MAQLRSWLQFLFSQTDVAPRVAPLAIDDWLSWLEFHQLAPLVWARLRDTEQLKHLPSPAVSALRRLVYFRMAVTTTREPALTEVLKAFQATGLEVVLLKGAALTWAGAYTNTLWREMGDYDLWLQAEQMPAARQCLQKLGYTPQHKPHRPLALRLAEQSEIEMIQPGIPSQVVDLHYHPFQGKWLGAVLPRGVEDTLWQRHIPVIRGDISSYRLSNEDNLLHLAIHFAVNHQMGRPGLRALWDVATSLQAWPVDWEAVLQRAHHWKLQTALYLVLHLAATWVAAPVPHEVLEDLCPSPLRQEWLEFILPSETILQGTTISTSHRRYVYLFALLDKPQVGVSLVRQAFFPQRQWLQLRYSQNGTCLLRLRYHHLRQFIRTPQL